MAVIGEQPSREFHTFLIHEAVNFLTFVFLGSEETEFAELFNRLKSKMFTYRRWRRICAEPESVEVLMQADKDKELVHTQQLLSFLIAFLMEWSPRLRARYIESISVVIHYRVLKKSLSISDHYISSLYFSIKYMWLKTFLTYLHLFYLYKFVECSAFRNITFFACRKTSHFSDFGCALFIISLRKCIKCVKLVKMFSILFCDFSGPPNTSFVKVTMARFGGDSLPRDVSFTL